MPEPNPEALPIILEFRDKLNDLAGNHAFALAGVAGTLEKIESIPLEKRTAESKNFFGHGEFYWQEWTLDSLPARLGPQGPVIRSIGQQWVVSVVTVWNEDIRPRLAEVEGKDSSEIIEPMMGDLNKMRNDIVHHGGIATKGNTGRCKALPWFEPGEAIHVMPEHIVFVLNQYGMVHHVSEIEGGGPWRNYGSL